MLFVRGQIVKRTSFAVTSKTNKVKYSVNDAAGNILFVYHLTTQLHTCYPVSSEIIEIPVKVKVFKGDYELYYQTPSEVETDKVF